MKSVKTRRSFGFFEAQPDNFDRKRVFAAMCILCVAKIHSVILSGVMREYFTVAVRAPLVSAAHIKRSGSMRM